MLLSLALSTSVFGQMSSEAPEAIRDPAAILAAAALHYNFSNPALKPWHLKATYQLYDEGGRPPDQGTYDSWWAAPGAYRSTWTRSNGTESLWHTADGKRFAQSSGDKVHVLERQIWLDLFRPLPELPDPQNARLERSTVQIGGIRVPCVRVIDKHPRRFEGPFGLLDVYCFDPKLPILILSFSSAVQTTTSFNGFSLFQNLALPRDLTVVVDNRTILSVHLAQVSAMSSTDPALTPPPGLEPDSPEVADDVSMISPAQSIKMHVPDYPPLARPVHVSGEVMLEVTIGKDGKVHDIRVVSSASPVLTDATKEMVSHWEFQPCLLDGKPVEVHRIIGMRYVLSPSGRVVVH